MPKKQKTEYPKYYINQVNGAFLVIKNKSYEDLVKGLPLIECDKNKKAI